MSLNHVAQLPFQEFCEVCEKIKNAKGAVKGEIFQRLVDDHRKLTAAKSKTESDFYPYLRLLLPQADKERGAYGIRETTLAKIYIRILTLPVQGPEAKKLMNYKAPGSSNTATADFADVAFWVLKSRCKESGTLTVRDINQRLDRIAQSNSENKPRAIDGELVKLITSTTAFQQKWLIRIILKDMKLGMGQAKMLTIFHPDAQDLFDSSNSLIKVCSTLHDLSVRLHVIEVEIFSPFRPMLSEKLDITKINASMKKEEDYVLENKFDGERFQIHMRDGQFKYFSRNGFDFTENYGSTFEAEGSLTRYLKDSLNSNVTNFIIDGEMMGWHKTKKVFSSKGIAFDVKKITDASSFQPCFCAFDILLLNDRILTNLPLSQRLSHLDSLFTDKEGVILHSKRTSVKSSEQVLNALNKAIDDQEEGIVLKNAQSLYKPNSRKAGWFKIKPEYTDGVMNELDLLIIGGYYAENRRLGWVGSVLLGVAVPPENQADNPSTFYAMGRVKLSLVAEETEELCRKLQPHWNLVDKAAPCPDGLFWTKDKPDLWIEPKNSYILQIKASELVRSNAFKTEYTVRFPRTEKIRYDKPWHDCLTLTEFVDLTKFSRGIEKLTSRHVDGEDIEDNLEISPRKKAKMLQVSRQFKSADTSGVQKVSDLFAGKEFCVMGGNGELSKSDVEVKVVEHGGHVVQNPGVDTFCILTGDKNLRVKNAIKAGIHNIASIDWFLRSIDTDLIATGQILEWTPQDLFGMSKSVAEDLSLKYDQYGDSFTDFTMLDSLKYSMKRVEETVKGIHLLPIELNELDKELFKGTSPYSFLRMCSATIITSEHETNLSSIQLSILKAQYVFFGGTYTEDLTDDSLTHVIVSRKCDNEEIKRIQELFCDSETKPMIVSTIWLEECFQKKALIEEIDFIVT